MSAPSQTITIGLVKGLRSTDPLALDLMRTYSASPAQVFWLLRLPTSLPYLFASVKVAIAISLIATLWLGVLPNAVLHYTQGAPTILASH